MWVPISPAHMNPGYCHSCRSFAIWYSEDLIVFVNIALLSRNFNMFGVYFVILKTMFLVHPSIGLFLFLSTSVIFINSICHVKLSLFINFLFIFFHIQVLYFYVSYFSKTIFSHIFGLFYVSLSREYVNIGFCFLKHYGFNYLHLTFNLSGIDFWLHEVGIFLFFSQMIGQFL